MKSYVKPLVLASNDLSEGVFAASGMIGGLDDAESGGAADTTEESHVGGNIDTTVDPGIADPDTGGEAEAADGGEAVAAESGDAGAADSGDAGAVESGDATPADSGETAPVEETPVVETPVDSGTDMGGAQTTNEPLDTVSGSYSLSVAGQWDGNINYDLYISNPTDNAARSITVICTCNGIVNAIDGNVSGTVNGDGTATIVFNNYGNLINPHDQFGPIYMHVSGTGEFNLQ